ncbi:MAG: psuG [Gemmataceae bacterium]|nr:psuG [Gemmataceae bacterium]
MRGYGLPRSQENCVMTPWLHVSEEVATALASDRPVVALESTLIAHGLPWPTNRDTAREVEQAVRAGGAIPATVAVWHGTPTVGLTPGQLDELAGTPGVLKAGRRDLGAAVGLRKLAATTVSATMALAHAAGIPVFATGGIGGAHRWNCGLRIADSKTGGSLRIRNPQSAIRNWKSFGTSPPT